MPKQRTAVDQGLPVCFLQYFRVLIYFCAFFFFSAELQEVLRWNAAAAEQPAGAW